jgi:phage terminase large subunit
VFQSASVDDILLSEEPEDHQIIIECIALTGDSGGQVCLDMTPLSGFTWPYYHIDQANEPGVIESWRVSLFENPFVSEDYKQTLVKLYGKDEIARRIYGLFTILEGAILKEFDESVHVLQDFPSIPSDWRRIRSIDLGARNPFVCGWYAFSPDGILYKYDEYYNENKGRNTDCETHTKNIKRQEHEQNETGKIKCRQFAYENTRRIEASLCDWELQTRIELEKYGILTIPALKDKQRSWEITNRLLKQRPPVIQIAPWCKNTIREIQGYHYKKVKEGNEVKEVEAKIDDHTVDEFLYAIMYFCGGAIWDPKMIRSG